MILVCSEEFKALESYEPFFMTLYCAFFVILKLETIISLNAWGESLGQ